MRRGHSLLICLLCLLAWVTLGSGRAAVVSLRADSDEDISLLLPPMAESLVYNYKGELSEDGYWTYTWDGLGHLLEMNRKGGTFAQPNLTAEKLLFSYDAQGRRIQKQRIWTTVTGGSAVTKVDTSRFLWDGWLPILELRTKNGTYTGRRWFLWGADLSGSREGMGGIGGLVGIIEESGTSETGAHTLGRTLLPLQDGLGNVTAVIDNATGKAIARYEYGPYGEPIGEIGDLDACPFRYQSKYYDAECQHYYFGYRYYDPRLGRWLSRDPLGEAGGFNLYAYCTNDPVNGHDPWGLENKVLPDTMPVCKPDPGKSGRFFVGFPVHRVVETYSFGGIPGLSPPGYECTSDVVFLDRSYSSEDLKLPETISKLRRFASDRLELQARDRQVEAWDGTLATIPKVEFYAANTAEACLSLVGAIESAAATPVSGGSSWGCCLLCLDGTATAVRRIFAGPEVEVESATCYTLQRAGLSKQNANTASFYLQLSANTAQICRGIASSGFLPRQSVPAANSGGRIFYVGEGAETLARKIASETGYKTIYNTWYGKIGEKVTPYLSQPTSRKMWDFLSARFANGAKQGDDVIGVFGRHRATGEHTLPIDSKSAWKRVEYPILESKGIPYRPVLTE